MNKTSAQKWASWALGLCFAAGALAAAGAQGGAKVETIASQPCWVIENDTVRLAVTQIGAQMAPVTFCLDSDRTVQPYHVSPWQGEGLKLDPPVLDSAARQTFSVCPSAETASPTKA